jgi:formate/nitrite transporter
MLALTVSGGLDPAWAARFPGIQKLLTGLTFPSALIYIIVAGGELFTSNVMYTTLGLLSRNLNVGKSILVCTTAFIANYLGCVLVAGFSVNLAGFLTKDPYHAYLVHAVQAKIIDAEFGILVLKAIPANFLVNVAVIMASAAEDVWGKIVAGYIPILSFAVIGMEHCIANDFYAHAAIFTSSQFNYGIWLWKTLIACTIGNIIGGMFVGAAYWYAYLAEAQLGHDHWLLSFRCGRCARKRKTTNDHETEQHHL